MSVPDPRTARGARGGRATIRLRLTAWFLLAMSMLVAAGSIATYLIVSDRLHADARSGAQVLARAAASVGEPDEIALDQLAGPGDHVWLIDSSGVVVAATQGDTSATTRAEAVAAIAGLPGHVTATAAGSEGVQALVARSTSGIDSTLSTLRLTLIGAGVAGLALSALLGWVLASRVLRPVDRMRREVDEISGDSLERRLPSGPPDELGLLADAFNRLLARAETAAREQESFVADASHELKTPITAVEGHARVVVRAIDRSDLPQARESAEIVLREARRLAVMLGELLTLAEAGAIPPAPAGATRLDLAVEEACSEMRALEPERDLVTELEEVAVAGEHGRLRELALILIDNAVKYSPGGTPVEVAVSAAPPLLTVRDHGPGLSAEDTERAFDRFFRGSAATLGPGSGLGLAIARVIAARSGAVVTLEPAPGGGTRAVVTFPAAPVS
jgi:two-component system sensor histidine kinase MprB